MKTVIILASVIGLAFCSTATMAADSSAQNPAIKGAGSIYPTPNATNKPNPQSTYKIVFALAGGSKSPGQVSDSLQQLARTVNLYASAGVPSSHTKYAGVVTLQGATILLDNKIYKNAYNVDNPNLKIVKQLKEKGVKFYMDEQTIDSLREKYSDLKDSDFDESVPRVQSAITTIIGLQKQGYILMMLPTFQGNINPDFWNNVIKTPNPG